MEDVPCDLFSRSQGTGTIREERADGKKRTNVGRNCRGSEGKKIKVIGKKRQEVFSGRSEKTGHKEASQDCRESLGYLQVLAVGPGNSW